MAGTLFRQVMVWDGSAAIPFPGDLLVHGNRIPRGGPEDRRRCRPRARFARQQVNYVIAAMYGF